MSEETTNDVNTIEDLIQHSLAQDYNKANEVFGNVMTTKLTDLLDQQKVKIAGQIYNDEPADEEDPLEDEDFENTEGEEEELEDEGLGSPEEEIEGAAV
jgi:hypothetical protein